MVTARGRPSGTATTIMVIAIMKKLRTSTPAAKVKISSSA